MYTFEEGKGLKRMF